MVPRWQIFHDFLHPAFLHFVARFRLCLKFALRPHHVCKYVWQTSNLRQLRLGKEKKIEEKEEETTG